MKPITLKLVADHTRAQIELSATLDAQQLETLISDLAELRANMTPPVPMERPKPGDGAERVSMQDEPSIMAVPLKDGRIRFWLRSHGFGWLVFNFTHQQCATLRDFFQVHAAHIDAGPSLFRESDSDGNTTH